MGRRASRPETRYARSDVSIAYQVVGHGPLDVAMMPGLPSHLELAGRVRGPRVGRPHESVTRTRLRFDGERAEVLWFAVRDRWSPRAPAVSHFRSGATRC